MSAGDREERLQDYLDGRMTTAERERFESQLARDPALRSRVESSRAIRDALRSEPEELPPGFYTRVRKRFEDERGRGTRRLPWWRSWEALGAATAALLVLALFLPPLMREDDAFELPVSAPPRARPGGAKPGGVPELRKSAAEDARETDSLSSGEDAEPEAPADRPAEPLAEADPAAVGGRLRDEASRVAEAEEEQRAPGSERERFAPSPATPPPRRADLGQVESRAKAQPPASPAPDDKNRERRAAAEGAFAETAPKTETQKRDAAWAPEPRPPIAVAPLAPGTLEPGALRVIDRAEVAPGARALTLAEPAAPGRRDPLRSPDFRTERWVLIGPRARPLDCGTIRIVEGPRLLTVLVGPATGAAGSPGGCKVVVPAGDAPVEIVEVGFDGR